MRAASQFRRRWPYAAFAFLLLLAALVAGSRPQSRPTTAEQAGQAAPAVYLALGDSLAAGLRADRTEARAAAYPGLVGRELAAKEPIEVVNLACSGETTATLVSGGTCTYTEGSQLAAAKALLQRAGDRVRLVTVDLGVNDLFPCLDATTGYDAACLRERVGEVRANLVTLIEDVRLRAPRAQVVVLNYYNAFVAFDLIGRDWAELADRSRPVHAALNDAIADAAGEKGATLADVATAFESGDRTPVGTEYGRVSVEVARICEWTTTCSDRDIHPNDAGQGVIADAVIAVLAAD